MSSSKKNKKTETSKKRALSTRKPKLTPALATTPSLSTLTQSESLGLSSTVQTTFNNLFSQALARHKKDVFEDRKDKLKEISHLDFSLFVESIPETEEELSSINILAIYEPNEYFGLHDWAIQNKNLFDVILTWDDKVLNNCENAIYTPFGHTWLKPDQYNKEHEKKFQLSHLCGNLLGANAH